MDVKIFVNCSGMTCSTVITTRDLKRRCFTFCTERANPWLAKKNNLSGLKKMVEGDG